MHVTPNAWGSFSIAFDFWAFGAATRLKRLARASPRRLFERVLLLPIEIIEAL